jgi:ribose/xylose/arabinose/galactoside ABC-type transport system permease subunit
MPFPVRLFKRSEWSLLLAIAVVILLTALFDEQHNYWRDPRSSVVDILRQTSMLGIFTLGAAIVIIAGGIDLSSGSVIAFGGSICATIMLLLAPKEMQEFQPVGIRVIAIAIAGTLLIGFLIGSFHAWLITVIGLPPFVATLASLVGLRSLGRAVVESATLSVQGTGKTQIQIYDEQFRWLANSVWIPVVLFAILSLCAWILMSRTVAGRHLHALGGNEQATRLSGIETDRLKWFAYCISAVLSALAGILYIGDQSVAEPQTLGRGYELNAIAAAVVGGCSLQGGVGTIPGTLLGALFLRVIIDGVAKMLKTGAELYEGLIVGAVVVIAVAVTQFRQARRGGTRFFGGPLGIVTIVNLTLLAGACAALIGQRGAMGPAKLSAATMSAALIILVSSRFLEGRRRRAEPVIGSGKEL